MNLPVLDQLIVNSAPTIWGLRPANIVTIKKSDFEGRESEIAGFGALFSRSRRVRLAKIYESAHAVQLMVYDRRALSARLRDKECRAMLHGRGYPDRGGVDSYLNTLSLKMRGRGEFPHEIGLFLGYPLEDVSGFVAHKGKNYKLNGYWKVYGDVEECKSRFAAFDSCRRSARAMLSRSGGAEALLAQVPAAGSAI
ncbi:MAG: DUF3793 family protein [Clostridiales Family XIII bacterium]|nr:DUF3793 family protein [Clostridiales Family XIII bacterium]